jgi:hypothetical protein
MARTHPNRPEGEQQLMTISLCRHRFPIQPPDGWIGAPGDCRGCGATWAAVQDDLQRQQDTIRMHTAHDGECSACRKPRMLFNYQREQQPWEDTEPPVRWLCIPCWSLAKTAEEVGDFATFADAFDRATDEQFERWLR